jgi:hypothetical protein
VRKAPYVNKLAKELKLHSESAVKEQFLRERIILKETRAREDAQARVEEREVSTLAFLDTSTMLAATQRLPRALYH